MNKSNELVKKMLILSKSNDFENAIEEWKKLDSNTGSGKQKKCMISHHPYCCRKFVNLETCNVIYLKCKYDVLNLPKKIILKKCDCSVNEEKLLSYGLYNYLSERLQVLRLLNKNNFSLHFHKLIKNKRSIGLNDFFNFYKRKLGFKGLIKLFLRIKKMRKCNDILEKHKKLFDMCYYLMKKKYKNQCARHIIQNNISK